MLFRSHRPEYYIHADTDASGKDIRGLAEFIVAKHRSGKVDDVQMRFRAPFARFENWSSDVNIGMAIQGSRLNQPDGGNAPMPQSDPLSGGTVDISPASPNENLPF